MFRRIGRYGKSFKIIKFRTIEGSEKEEKAIKEIKKRIRSNKTGSKLPNSENFRKTSLINTTINKCIKREIWAL
ncbi:MAG: hypothetical protein ACLRQZ_07015 [Clostridia bacterium]